MKRCSREKRAFTLVEILIVLLLLGILAGAMMLVSFSATSKAEATRIVEDMRSMKCAATFFFADYGRWPVWMKTGPSTISEIHGGQGPEKYLEKMPIGPQYWVGIASNSESVAVMLDASSLGPLVKQRLQAMFPGIPLYGSSTSGDFGETPYTTEDYALWYIKKN